MSKAVLMSIQPKWCELIASGKKTVEVRKTKPKPSTPFKCYIYCTKESYKGKYLHTSNQHGKLLFWHNPNDTTITVQPEEYDYTAYTCCGQVVGEFVCDEIYDIGYSPYNHGSFISDIDGCLSNTDNLYEKSCLELGEMFDYLSQGYGYGWHISNLVIYDKPKELSKFTGLRKTKFGYEPVKMQRPPQSWCYVEEKE